MSNWPTLGLGNAAKREEIGGKESAEKRDQRTKDTNITRKRNTGIRESGR